MGVKVYSLNEAPEVPSPEVPAPTPGDVVAVGEAYENVSMLEFACLIHDYEQNMFEAVIATDFMEAVQEQVMLEADGDEAAADDAGDAADTGEAKKSSFKDKVGAAAGKAADAARAIKKKILELLEAFKKKLNGFVQKVRIKFGDLLKQDKKIIENYDKIKPEKLKGFKAPRANYVLIQRMFGKGGNDNFEKIAGTITGACVNTVNHITDIDNASTAEDINAAKDKVLNGIDGTAKKLEEFVGSFKEFEKDGKEANRRELAGSETGTKIEAENIDRAIVHGTFTGEYGYKTIEKTVGEQIKTLDGLVAKTKAVIKENDVDELTKLQAHAVNEIVTKLLGVISKFNNEMTTAYAHAYADVRKYALSAIAYANKTAPKDKAEEAKQEAAQWAICEASDEYVFETLALI